MKNKLSNKIAIIGLGMVGTAIGHLLKKSGREIAALCDKLPPATKRAVLYTGGKPYQDAQNAAAAADIILITTPDDSIENVCRKIAAPEVLHNKLVIHMSGAGSLDLLDTAKKAGAITACIHPLQSFSSIDNAIKNIPGSIFGITAERKAKTSAQLFVHDLRGIPVFISPQHKPLYHTAACFASNYLVTLLNVVESIYRAIGLSKSKAQKAYLPLIYGTLRNIEASGSVRALTGPIARGDIGTVQKHISALNNVNPQYLPLYSILGEAATKIAQKKGTLSSQQAKKISQLLKGALEHEYSKQKQP